MQRAAYRSWFPRLAIAAVLCVTQGTADADEHEPERGRLPDGRAFRTDGDGNQLVDYIAELEFANKGLEGRIFGLQDKLRERDSRDATSGKKPEPQVCPIMACPKIESAACPACADNTGDIRGLERKVTALQTEIVESDTERELEKTSLEEDLGQCKESKAHFESTAASLNESLGEMRSTLAERDNALQLARAQVTEARYKQQRLSLAAKQGGTSEGRASLGGSVATYNSATNSDVASSALLSARAQLRARVSELTTMVRARDEQFLKADQRGKSLQIRPAALKTRTGFELGDAAQATRSANNFKAIADISRELDALRRILEDDIRLGAKLGKK